MINRPPASVKRWGYKASYYYVGSRPTVDPTLAEPERQQKSAQPAILSEFQISYSSFPPKLLNVLRFRALPGWRLICCLDSTGSTTTTLGV
jgi:hypothetical protein